MTLKRRVGELERTSRGSAVVSLIQYEDETVDSARQAYRWWRSGPWKSGNSGDDPKARRARPRSCHVLGVIGSQIMMLKRRVDALEGGNCASALSPQVKAWLGWKLTESEKQLLTNDTDSEPVDIETLPSDARAWLYG